MKHTFVCLSGAPCKDAQQYDVEAGVCASELARAAFPNLKVAMLMPLVPAVSLLASESEIESEIESEADADEVDQKGDKSSSEFQLCEPSDVFLQPTTFAVVDLSKYTIGSCAKQGLLLAGKWVFAATGRKWTDDVMCEAARGGHLAFAQWARASGCDWTSDVMPAAARGGHLEFAKWARASGCESTSDVICEAARGGHLVFAQWARASGCEWGLGVIWAAARGGHLEFAKWARSQGCPWDMCTLRAAAYAGHLEFGKWARSEGCQE